MSITSDTGIVDLSRIVIANERYLRVKQSIIQITRDLAAAFVRETSHIFCTEAL